MLDKRNQKLYKSLRGEYRRYARRLRATLLDCCKGKDEINETLGDVFSMLAEAQGAGRDFADVIPDPAASIRETALCFPARKIRHNTVIGLIVCVALLLLCAAYTVIVTLTTPVTLDEVRKIDFDRDLRVASWQPIPNAEEYHVYLDGDLYAITQRPEIAFDKDTVLAQTFYLMVKPVGSGRYKSPFSSSVEIINYPEITVYFSDFDPMENPADLSWQAYQSYDRICLILQTTHAFYARLTTPAPLEIESIYQYSTAGVDGAHIENAYVDPEGLFQDNATYEITIAYHADEDDLGGARYYRLDMRLFTLLEYADTQSPVLPKGMMLFAGDPYPTPENQRIYTVDRAQFQTVSSPLYIGGYFNDVWENNIFPGIRHAIYDIYNVRYLLMRNTASMESPFILRECPVISAAQGETTIKKGWTMISAEHSGIPGAPEQLILSSDQAVSVHALYYRKNDGGDLSYRISFSADERPYVIAGQDWNCPLHEGEILYLIVYASEECAIRMQSAAAD